LKSTTTQKSEFKAETEFREEYDDEGNLCAYSRIETDRRYYFSLNLAAQFTEKDRRTVTKAARDLESFAGPGGAKLFRSHHILELVMQREL
jgi:hypothetical protein